MRPIQNPIGRGVYGALALLLAWAGALQLNDPDPAAWIAIYGGAAVVVGAVAAGRRPPVWSVALVGGVAAAWAAWVVYTIFGKGQLTPMFPDDAGTGWLLVDAEEGRELGGLTIVVVAMVAVAGALLTSRGAKTDA